MNLTPRVMEDLLTVYLAGDASEDTRTLVDAYAREHADFAAKRNAASAVTFGSIPDVGQDAAHELHTLRRTRQLLFLRTVFLAWAIVFTLLPMTFVFDKSSIRFVFWGQHAGLVSAFWSLAVASWAAWYVMQRRVAPVGL